MSALKLFLGCALFVAPFVHAVEMDQMWGDAIVKLRPEDATKGQLFDDGNYAMFIHWGVYSHIANNYKGNTYYGIAEWIMHMAKISPEDYIEAAKEFNPTEFDAGTIARLARDAGMKYIVITSKHHDGFAMYDSEASDFNIVDHTPFDRDPMKELAKACEKYGIGFGFYYSHRIDWTAPGAANSKVNNKPDGSPADFEYYFRTKCRPQVQEITSQYGPLAVVWFDLPGKMPKELVDITKRNQPQALINSRIGAGLGDYRTFGDMQIPYENVNGRWETVDTSNDSWAFAWYDTNWKSPKEIASRLISTVARGGTYMLNVGPDGLGRVPEANQRALRSAGEWISRYPFVVYATDASPWGRALPWGDVTVKGNQLFLCILKKPADNTLNLPGLATPIKSVSLLDGRRKIPLRYVKQNGWTRLQLPSEIAEPLIPVIEVELEGAPKIDSAFELGSRNNPTLVGLDPALETKIYANFAGVDGARKSEARWMEKFGEWKHVYQISDWKGSKGKAIYKVEVLEPGYYKVDLTYRGNDRPVWRVDLEGHGFIQNEQTSGSVFQQHPIGVLYFPEPGQYSLSVSNVNAPESSGEDRRNRRSRNAAAGWALKAVHLTRMEM